MNIGNSLSRGDVVLLPIAFVSGVGTKVRPAVVVQNDNPNHRLNSTLVAIITSINTRALTEPSQPEFGISHSILASLGKAGISPVAYGSEEHGGETHGLGCTVLRGRRFLQRL